jgi:hypothetical protein
MEERPPPSPESGAWRRARLFAKLTTAPSRRRPMIRKLKSGEYRIYSIKKDAQSGRRRNLGTFETLEAAKKHERAIQYFKHQ